MSFVFVQFLCRMVLSGASFASLLIPIGSDQIQLRFAEGIVPCDLSRMQCALPDQPVDSSIWTCKSQPVKAQINDGLVHPIDWSSLRFVSV